MSLYDDVKNKYEQLRTQAENAHIQGRRPEDVPLTLADGRQILGLLLALTTRYEHHSHVVEVNKKERETGGPL